MSCRAVLARSLVTVVLLVIQRRVDAGCPPDTLAEWDLAHPAIAWEDAYDRAAAWSAPGSQLTLCGTFQGTCGPMIGFDALSADSELSWVADQLVSLGSSDSLTPNGIQVTNYSGGRLRIFQGAPRDVPDWRVMPANPPNAVFPGAYENGTLLYEASIGAASLVMAESRIGIAIGGFSAAFVGTGGVLLAAIEGGKISANSWCLPFRDCYNGLLSTSTGASQGGSLSYRAATSTRPSTWGKLKSIYR